MLVGLYIPATTLAIIFNPRSFFNFFQALMARKAPYIWEWHFEMFLPSICFKVLIKCGISLLFRIQYSSFIFYEFNKQFCLVI